MDSIIIHLLGLQVTFTIRILITQIDAFAWFEARRMERTAKNH